MHSQAPCYDYWQVHGTHPADAMLVIAYIVCLSQSCTVGDVFCLHLLPIIVYIVYLLQSCTVSIAFCPHLLLCTLL